ncbi:MAG TPA: PEPxxWA-CTERM sorting domain-containing protein [Phenylobacterium sp.]|jgi:hypothetical protein|nr:PEPxxWA-CTERM sorting domain-containing protein [Phenylobacterium sp.]
MININRSKFGKNIVALCAFGALGLGALSARADVIQMDQGALFEAQYDYNGMGNGRGVGFSANQNFSITSAGIDLGVQGGALGADYTLSVYSSTDGHDAGSVLASTTFSDLTIGEGWVDRALNFSFTAGSFYVIDFARVDGQHLDDLGTHYSWEDQVPAGRPVTYGPLTVLEGFEGAPPNNSNPLIPHMRFNADLAGGAVPEPASWALMIVGFAGIGAALRRRTASAVA